MSLVHLPARVRAAPLDTVEAPPDHQVRKLQAAASGDSGELADLYGAILVVVPLAFVLRWLWP